MLYSQGDGVNTFLSSGLLYLRVSLSTIVSCYVYGNLPWHDHVLPGTLIIKIMCVNHLYLQG